MDWVKEAWVQLGAVGLLLVALVYWIKTSAAELTNAVKGLHP